MSYLDEVKPTYIENWPASLCSLSVAQVDVPLTVDEAACLGSNIIDYADAFPPFGRPIDGIRNRVSQAVERFPNGAFIRLGSRSPKDSWLGYQTGFKVLPGTDPLRFMLDASERVADDLRLAIQSDYAPHIFVRQWVDIEPAQEFRCFMRDRKLVGISQYNYRDYFPELNGEADTIVWAIESFFESFVAACAGWLDDVVFDVIVRCCGNMLRQWSVTLLEANPFFEMTDPCLYDWRNGGDFDGGIRLTGEKADAGSPPL